MSSSAEKIDKLRNLFLDSNGQLSKSEISIKLGCSEDHVKRIIRVLKRKYDFPVEYQRRLKKYVCDLSKTDRTEVPGFFITSEEIALLFSLRNIMIGSSSRSFGNVMVRFWDKIERLCESHDIPLSSWEEKIKILSIAGRGVDDGVFQKVINALANDKVMKLEYKPLGKKVKIYEVSPLKILRYKDNWYLDVLDHNNSIMKVFAISRIVGASISAKKVKRVPKNQSKEYFSSSYGMFTGVANKKAKLRFTGIAAEEVSQQQWHPKEVGKKLRNGDYELIVPYNIAHELVMEIYRWGRLVKVISPISLKRSVIYELRAALKQY